MMYYLPKDYKIKRINDAGSKARWDIEDIMAQMGISPIGRHHGISHSRIHHFFMTLMSVIRIALRINHGNILILQYPVKYYSTICRIAQRKKQTFQHRRRRRYKRGIQSHHRKVRLKK